MAADLVPTGPGSGGANPTRASSLPSSANMPRSPATLAFVPSSIEVDEALQLLANDAMAVGVDLDPAKP